jgi:hypothetical protein
MRRDTIRPTGSLTWADITGEHNDDDRGLFRVLGNGLAIIVPVGTVIFLAVVGAVSLLP